MSNHQQVMIWHIKTVYTKESIVHRLHVKLKLFGSHKSPSEIYTLTINNLIKQRFSEIIY